MTSGRKPAVDDDLRILKGIIFDPFTGFLIASLGIAGVGLVTDIVTKYKAAKKAKKDDKKLAASGKLELDTEQLKQLNTLSKDEQKIVNSLLPYLEAHGEEFLNELPKIEKAALEKAAAAEPQIPQIPGAQELGFPPVQDVTGEIRSETDFAPIEKQTLRQFQEQILPGIKEQFAGVGGLKSSGFQGAAQAGGERLAESLAALRSKFGLERGSVLGQLGLKQGALEQQRAASAGQLGTQRYQLGQQGQAQKFGQQLNLANLGLQENAQELQRRQLGLSAGASILNRGSLATIIPPTPVADTTGASLMAMAGKFGGKLLGGYDFSKI